MAGKLRVPADVGVEVVVADKVSKESVNFRRAPHPSEKRCGNCDMFRVPAQCTLVRGVIGASMLCSEWIAEKK